MSGGRLAALLLVVLAIGAGGWWMSRPAGGTRAAAADSGAVPKAPPEVQVQAAPRRLSPALAMRLVRQEAQLACDGYVRVALKDTSVRTALAGTPDRAVTLTGARRLLVVGTYGKPGGSRTPFACEVEQEPRGYKLISLTR